MCTQSTPPPPVLYKYLPFKAAKSMLENRSLKFAVRNELNDPFETMPGGYYPLSPEEKSRFKTYCINNKVRFETTKEVFSSYGIRFDTQEELYKLIQNDPPNIVPILDISTDKIYEEIIDRNDWSHFENLISEQYGILCLSESYNNILMWSHYADKHQGIVIGLKTETLNGLRKVKYENRRPLIPLHCMTYEEKPHEYEQAVIDVLSQKSKDWEYEKEWRLIDRLSNLTPKVSENKKTIYLREPIDVSIFDVIYFGSKTPPVQQKEIRDICHKNNIKTIFFTSNI